MGRVHYLVMEYVDGRDLGTVVKERGRLPWAEAVEYVLQAAQGLAYAHSQRVVHRDIKPGNLLADQQGTVKALDMGLARLFSAALEGAGTAPGESKASAQDWIAAGLVALVNRCPQVAEKCFAQAEALGAERTKYFAPLAEVGLEQAGEILAKADEALGAGRALLAEGKWAEARSRFGEAAKEYQRIIGAVAELRRKYGRVGWLQAQAGAVEAAEGLTRRGLAESQAEGLYCQAAELFEQKEFYDLKPLVEELKTRHSTSRAVTDAPRQF